MLLWDASFVEWYYPALASGATHVAINRSTGIATMERLEANPAEFSKLVAGAKAIAELHTCPHCLASHWKDVFEAMRRRPRLRGNIRVAAAAVPRLVSAVCPHRGRGGAAAVRDNPRNIRVAAAAVPRLVSAVCPRRGRGGAASRRRRSRGIPRRAPRERVLSSCRESARTAGERFGYEAVLDDPKRLLPVLERAGACDKYPECAVSFGDDSSNPKISRGVDLCAWLRGKK